MPFNPNEPCPHRETRLAKRTYANGATHFGRQCLACGDWIPTKKPSVLESLKAVDFDPAIKEKHQASVTAYYEQQRAEHERQLEKESAEWWAAYNDYMRSARWADKRRRVLDRDKEMCQACLKRKASQVHHKTYEHCQNEQGEFGYEPLFELESICTICHDALTIIDRSKRNGNHRS